MSYVERATSSHRARVPRTTSSTSAVVGRRAALRRGAALAALACLASVGCQSVTPAPLPARQMAPPYLVGPPDILLVSVLPAPVIEREVVVRPDGFITIDLVGDIMAAGQRPQEIADDIQKRMGRFKRDAIVSVAVTGSLSDAITVLGEVLQPGTFPMERDMRLAEAIGLRGGPSKFAAKARIRIIRMQDGAPIVIPGDLGRIEKGDLSSNVALHKGDIVVVPPTVFAMVGYKISAVLFPFSPILSAMAGAGLASLF